MDLKNIKSTDEDSGDKKSKRFVLDRFSKPRPSKDIQFDYKDIETLGRYVTEHGKIVPRRVTRVSAQQQADLTTAIKRARTLALLSHVGRN